MWRAEGQPGLASSRGPGYLGTMSRPQIATAAGLLFVVAYVVLVVTLPDLFSRMHWGVEALYWLVAGIVWVFPVRWLMLWSVGKR